MIRQILAGLFMVAAASYAHSAAHAEIRKNPARGEAVVILSAQERDSADLAGDPCRDPAHSSLTMYFQSPGTPSLICLLRVPPPKDEDASPPGEEIDVFGDDCMQLRISRNGRSLTFLRLDSSDTCKAGESGSRTTIIVGPSIVRGEGACSVVGAVGESC